MAEATFVQRLQVAADRVAADFATSGFPALVAVDGDEPPRLAVALDNDSVLVPPAGLPVEETSTVDAISVEVADVVLDAVSEMTGTIAITCPTHQLGCHPLLDTSGTAVWHCVGDKGHAVGAIGGLDETTS